ncbi:non-ribosomal peptide synthetase [Gordonia sp. 'Campus']|uniref:non-ribosomal peptide synthetase n=1 Tax=Gordonia sp. 'Campus' TaxID=2915824 RepID=UPI001EE4D877|nr:non-ribosomal peptide synthetase [Gordonia sp. 'Campus']
MSESSSTPGTSTPGTARRFALSAAQRSLWFTQQAAPDVPINVAQYVELDGPIDVELFVRATSAAVQRALFTQLRFDETDDGLVGVYDPALHYWADIIDLRDRPDPRAVAEEMMAQDYSRPLDPRVDRTARGCLFRLADDKSLVYNRGHHLLSDGMGGKDRMVEALAAYHAAVTGEPAPAQKPVDLDLPARADAQYRESSRFGTDRAYWRENMAGVGVAATLAHRPGRPAAVARRVAAQVPDRTMAALRDVAQQQSTILPNVIVAAFAAYLARAAAQGDEVIFQFPVAARTTAALRSTPLPVANIVPLRTRVTAEATVADALRTTQTALMGALRHQRFRGEDIWADVAADETSGRTPRTAAQERSGPMLNLMLFDREFPCGEATATFHILTVGPADDLTINIYPVPGEDHQASLMIGVEANPHRYDAAEVAEHHRQFLSMLDTFTAALLDSPDTRVDDLPLRVDAPETVLNSEIGSASTGSVSEVLAAAVARHRDQSAAATEGAGTETYDQMHTRARDLGARLRTLGARPGTVVGVALRSRTDRMLAWWAIAESGAATILTDPDAPSMKAAPPAARPMLVLVDDGTPSGPRADGLYTLADIGSVAPSPDRRQSAADDIACLVADPGGSGGRGSMIAVPQRAVATLIAQGVFADATPGPGHGRLAGITPRGSWAEHLEFAACAATGFRLVDPSAESATHAVVTPGQLHDHAVSTLAPNVLVVGSDAAPAPIVQLAVGRDVRAPYCPRGVLGPYTSPDRIAPDAPLDRPLPGGGPRPGVDLAILDHRMRPLPAGVTGDIYVAGSLSAQCFAGEAGRTAAVFVACPWRPGERMVATGDRGHLDPGGGGLVVDHRAGEVSTVGGVRVDLAVLERAAAEVAGVARAVSVIAGGEIHVGIVPVGAEPGGCTKSADRQRIRASVRRRVDAELPTVLWPRRVAMLDSLPLDASGGVDRTAAAALIAAAPESRAAHRQPETATERAVADAVTDVLGVSQPSMDDELVQLGATSLGFMQLATHLGETLRVVVNVRDLADVTTLAELAAVIESAAPRSVSASGVVRCRPTRAQQQIWLLNRADKHATVYHLAVRLTLGEGIAADVVRAALIDVAARHEALRTVYPDVDGEPLAHVRGVTEARAAAPITGATLDSVGTELAVSAPFDLTVDAPWRAVVDASGEQTEVVLVAHHIAIDEWSLHIVVDDFATAIRARRDGDEPVWSTEAVSVSAMLDARRQGASPAAEVFWAKMMRGAPTGISLPEPAVRSQTGLTAGPAVYRHRRIGRDVRERATARAREAGTTLNTLLCVALSSTLGEYADTDDILLSMPVSGRFTTEELRPVGMFVETVPVRTVDVRRSRVTDALATVGEDLTTAIAHADAGPTGLADVIFAYHATRPDLTGSAVFAAAEPLPTHQARTALEVTVFDEQDGLTVTLTIAEQRVDVAAADAVLERFIDTVAALGSVAPDAIIARCSPVPVHSSADRHARRTAPVDPIEALRDHARRRPDAIAVIAGAHRVSYRELLERAEGMARELRDTGVRPGDRVALLTGNGADSVVAIVASLIADAVYVPIDPDSPRSRIDLQLAATSPAAIVDAGPVISRGAGHGVAQTIPGGAYVIHTSGSTGIPKAVLVTRENLAAMLGAALGVVGATPDDVWSRVHSYAFDFSVWEVLGALASGGSVVDMDLATVRDPELLAVSIERHGVTICSQTPTAFATLIDPTLRATGPASPLRSLRTVVFGGEALSPRTLRAWAADHPDTRLVNMYGITETTVHLTAVDVDVDDERSHIGGPLDGCDAVVLDRQLRPVPTGAIGELYVVADQVALGYHNALGLTATRFVADPGGSGRRMYRTGDRVREIAPGRLIYLGRNDDQVQIRGYRIELGEIGAVLRGVPGVGDARVLVEPGAHPGDERLLAFVTEDGLADFDVLDALSEDAILAACAERLPAHMIPSRLAIVDGWPRTSTGKLDRGRLVGMLAAPPASSTRTLTATEQAVAAAMASVTGSDPAAPGADTDFFAAGGTSLSAARLVATLAGMGHRITVADVFEQPTVEGLAARVRPAVDPSGATVPTLASTPDDTQIPVELPLTPEQMDLWLRWRTQPEFTGYLMPFAMPVDAPVHDIRRALREIVTRHDALRTGFPMRGAQPVQHRWDVDAVGAHLDAELAVEVYVSTPDALPVELDALLVPIDLTADLPWRVRLCRVGTQTWLLVVAHHIAVDGETFPILASEFDQALGGALPPPGDVDYRRYSMWRQATLAATRTDLVAHWTAAFARPVERLRLPEVNLQAATGPGSTGTDSAGADTALTVHRAHRSLDGATTQTLDALAPALRSTAFIVVHTALAAVLARQADSDVVTIGTALSGRIDPRLLAVPGLFARAVPLHTPVDLDLPFADLVASVTAVDLGAFEHADLPLTEITDIADPGRVGAGAPLFEVSFGAVPDEVVAAALAEGDPSSGMSSSGMSSSGMSSSGMSSSGVPLAFGVPLFGIDVSMYRRNGRLHLTMACTDEVAGAARLDALCDLVVETLGRGVAEPTRPTVEVLAPGGPDGVELFRDNDGGPVDGHRVETLDVLLTAGLGRRPDVPAIIDRRYEIPGHGPVVDNAGFDRLSTVAARALIELGIGPGDVVVALLPRSVFGVIATTAAARAGAAFVNLDPADPAERRRMIIGRCRPRAVFTLAGVAEAGTDPGVPVLALDRLLGAPDESVAAAAVFDPAERVRPVSPDDVAYITFTSGTTGVPKGVEVTHRGLAGWARDTAERLRLEPSDRVMHTYATGFDAHLMGVVPPLLAGATIVLCPPEVIAADELAAEVDDERVTVLLTTPSVLATMNPDELGRVRHVAVGGEPLGAGLVREWTRLHTLSNEYGPTEATVAAGSARYAQGGAAFDGTVHIGHPLAGVVVHVLDRALRPVPDHTVGELYLAGNCLARGYLDDPATTARAFVADRAGRRMYRTGDLVHRRGDGTFVIHGRTDDQVKIRGVRLEPAEVDAALSGLPGVATSVTAARTTPAGEKILVSWVVPESGRLDHDRATGRRGVLAELPAQLAHLLPRSMIPTAIVPVSALPTGRNGKIDVAALPDPEFAGTTTGSGAEVGRPLSGATEELVAAVWAEVLERPVESMSADSDFFAEGGTSLSATQVTSRLSSATGSDIGVRTLFEARTVARVAQRVDEMLADAAPREQDSSPVPTRLPVPEHLPLAYPQRRMWIHHHFDPQSTAYHVPVVLRITGRVDLARLRKAVDEVVAAHAVLRTVYPDSPAGPVQRRIEHRSPVLRHRVVDAADGPDGLRRQVLDHLRRPFDLENETGFRATVFELDSAEEPDTHLAAVLHHIAIDGWSIRVLLADLIRAYDGERLSVPADEAFTYADFTQWQIARLGDPSDPGSRHARELRFWTSTLAGAPDPVRLPGRRDVDPTGETGRISASLDGTGPLHQAAKTLSATVFQVAHAALATVVGQWTGQWDTVIGVPVHGRHAPEWESVVGMFVNTVALRTRLRPDAPIREVIEQARDVALAAQPHSDVPYEDVARTVRPGAREGGDPLISVLLVNQDVVPQSSGEVTLSGPVATLVPEVTATVDAKFDVEVVLAEHDDELHITVVHSGHIPGDVAQALLDDFRAMLTAVGEDTERPFPALSGHGTPAETSGRSTPSTEPQADPADWASLVPAITAIMTEVLESPDPPPAHPAVAPDDDFFVLGGTSLSATRVTSALGRRLGRRIPTRLLFENPTPAALARAVHDLEPEADDTTPADTTPAGAVAAEPGDTGPVGEGEPLAPTQRRMWVGAQMLGEVPIYAVPVAVPVPAGVDESEIDTAIEVLVARHSALRTRYLATPAGPRQVVVDGWSPRVRRVSGTDLAQPGGLSALSVPFDLTGDPPVRVWVVVDGSGAGDAAPVAVVLVAHHIAMDGESATIVDHELRSLLAGNELDSAPTGFEVVARRMVAEEERSRPQLLDHWRRSLDGYSGELDLAQRRPAARDLRTAMTEYPVRGDAAQAVSAAARRAQASEFHVLHAATVLALAAQSGADDIALATPASMRRDTDTARTVGMLISTVVLRTRIVAGTTVGEFIARVRDDDLAALDHAAIAFDDVVALIDPPRMPGRHPLVQVAFSVAQTPVPDSPVAPDPMTQGPDVARVDIVDPVDAVDTVDWMTPRSEFDLHVVAVPDEDGWRLQLHHARELFDDSVIRGLGERLLAAVEAVTGDPGRRVAAVEPLTVAERRFVTDRARAAAPTGAEPLLAELFAEAAAAYPDRPAIADGVRTLTYRRLDAWISVTARSLRARGLGVGDAVAVVVPRSIESVVAIWAVSRIGGVCVPVDVTYPSARIDHVVAGARASVITEADIPVEPIEPVVPEPVTVVPRDSLAYIITTSGTTGTPNIVGVTHRGVHRVASLGDVEPSDRVGMAISPGFDATLHDMLLPLAAGATLVVVPAAIAGGTELTRFLDRTAVSVFTATPSVMRTLRPAGIGALRLVYIGGEALAEDLAAAWADHAQVLNIYGPTETTVTVSTSAFRRGEPIRLGHPRPGIGAEVLDPQLRHVPPGVVGELYIAGTGVARGYLGAPALTAATFVAGPDGKRRYRTGDLVRWDRETGQLVYLGRADRQVKIRGQRVEPAEIDAVLVRAGAQRSATVLRRGPAGDALVSYVVSPTTSIADLIAACRARLPRHMVPSRIVEMTDLPRSGAGKIDEKRLPEPVWSESMRDPETPLEAAVLDAFRAVLGETGETPNGGVRVGMDDDFFAAGGNSLALLQLRDELERRTGRIVAGADLFTHRTPADIAGLLTSGVSVGAEHRVVPLSPARGTAGAVDTTVWCVHTATGLAEPLRPLGDSLRTATVFGLQLPELVLADRDMPRTVEDIAALHVEAIRHTQPTGPYRLVGWSVGGLLAHEIARQLVDSGARVAQLVLLDARTPAELASVGDDELRVGDHPLRALAERFDPLAVQRFEDRSAALAAAARAYDLRPVVADEIVYVAAEDNPAPQRWAEAVGNGPGVEVMAVDVTHADLGRPEVLARIARRIEEEW